MRAVYTVGEITRCFGNGDTRLLHKIRLSEFTNCVNWILEWKRLSRNLWNHSPVAQRHPLPNARTMRTALISCASFLLVALPVFAQKDAAVSGEADALAAIEKLMAKTRQGRDKPTESDLKIRQEAGTEMAKLGERFLKDYPQSEKAEDVHGLINVGLLEASVAGDAAAAEALQKRATNVKDATLSRAGEVAHLRGQPHRAMGHQERKERR
jgi:hypothetical protein